MTDLSAFLYASGIKDDIKNALGRLKNGIKNTVGSEWNRFRNDNRGCVDLDALAGGFGIKGKSDVPYYFRGTTEGYPGNASVQRLGVTPTSTDPVIATIFATNGEQYGKGILYIANTTDLKGVPIVSSNVLSGLENEVVFGIQPIGFANKASVGISASQAREILGNMGYDIPSSIMRGDISNIISSVPRLKPNEIISFVKMAGGM